MANNSVIQQHHALQQAVGKDNAVLNKLIANNNVKINAPENMLALSNDAGLATATPRHASNHAAIDEVQNAISDKFGDRPTQFGISNLDLMKANSTSLTAAQRAVREQVFREATALAENLRDYTAKAILDHDLPLVGVTAADAARVFGTAADGSAEFATGSASNSLAAFRADTQAIKAAGGDVSWRAFNTAAKVEKLLDYAKTNNLKLFGTKSTLAGLESYLTARGLTPAATVIAVGDEVVAGVDRAAAVAAGGRALGVASAILLSGADAVSEYASARANGESVLSADGRAAVKVLEGAAIGALFLVPGVAEAALIGGSVLAGAIVVKSVVSSAWDYLGSPLERLGGRLSEGDLADAKAAAIDVGAAIDKWAQDVVAPYVKNLADNVSAFASDPAGHLESLARQIWGATRTLSDQSAS
ncbi:hypothetical protein K3F48_22540 [Methylosinus sp. Sm6]|nr:hypothetical protein [Methylosinus sp. Sm6]